MRAVLLIPLYIRWHYSQALQDGLHLIEKWVGIIQSYFLSTLEMKAGVLPAHGFKPVPHGPSSIAMGFALSVVKLVLYCMAVAGMVVVIVLGVIGMVIWLIMPFVIVFLIVFGINLFLS